MVLISRVTLDNTFKALGTARNNLAAFFAEVDKDNIGKLTGTAIDAQIALFANNAELLGKQVAANEKAIEGYQLQLQGLNGKDVGAALEIQDSFAISAGIPAAVPDIKPGAPPRADYWTSISVEVSSSYTAEQTSSSANSFSAGGSAGWGLWSVGGGVSHSDATSDVAKQMANSSIKASFDCMRVDITRSWLRAELFYDDDLRVASGNL